MKKLIFITVIAFGLGSVGCKTKKTTSENSDYALLNATTWEVAALEKNPIDKNQNIPSITFNTDEMRISGSGGCNKISGTFKAQANSDQMSFSQTIATRMACINMETESTFLKLLEKVSSFKVEKNKLIFYDSNRNELISFIQKN